MIFVWVVFNLNWYISLRLYIYSLFQVLSATYAACFYVYIWFRYFFRLRSAKFNGPFITILILMRIITVFLNLLNFIKSHQSFLLSFLLLNSFLMFLQRYLKLIHQSKTSIFDDILSSWATSLKSLGRYPLRHKNILKQIWSRLNESYSIFNPSGVCLNLLLSPTFGKACK